MAPVFPSNILLRAVARILDQRLQQGANPIRNLQSIFDHGYLPVLSYALIRYDLSLPPNVANAQNAILSLDAYTYHPRVVMSLLNAFDRLALVLSPEQMEALENLPVPPLDSTEATLRTLHGQEPLTSRTAMLR
ncbi:hypothetical protein BKA70DRAFT_1451813 [Coprinopsis sp. MPI-PUGE-AT-0042]|nr:hypothetical protein BKA70DRAFT_1451813 [Coprinopsis sp. MPI-PUGE-AT-0042]